MREHLIRVYPYDEPQNGFDGNGLAVLDPESCESEKELNGRWDVTLTHLIDSWGKWKNLIGQNILKVSGQLFRIDEQEVGADESGEYITAHAKHITYDLADDFIDTLTIDPTNINDYLNRLKSGAVQVPGNSPYTFEITGDTNDFPLTYSGTIKEESVLGAIMGEDDSFINRCGGRIYRDNFKLKIGKSMPESSGKSFHISMSLDMTKIKQKYDYSNWVTYLICYGVSSDGQTSSIHREVRSLTAREKAAWHVHHARVRCVTFNYSDFSDFASEKFNYDVNAYWNAVKTPGMTLEVEIADIRSDPKYSDFMRLLDCDTGVIGTVSYPYLGIELQQEITAVKRNELTGEITSVTIGDLPDSLVRPNYFADVVERARTDMEDEPPEMNIAAMEQMTIAELEEMTISQLEG